jgi:arabinan endo-1,5-alpha-L-arabinosidase
MSRTVKYVALLVALLTGAALLPAYAVQRPAPDRPGAYRNPLAPTVRGNTTVDSCADPTVLRGRGRFAQTWYMYCTTDPLNDQDTAGSAPATFHPLPTMQSADLVHWTYVGDALPELPSWAAEEALAWAPDVVYSRTFDRYYLSFVVTDTSDALSGEAGCTTDSAIGVATSTSPTGPWTVSEAPLVAPRRAGPGCDFYWTFDPDVFGDSIQRRSVLYYGSYYGGVFAQRVRLSPTGMALRGRATQVARGQSTEPDLDPVALRRPTQLALSGRGRALPPAQQVAIGNRYEGANVVRRGRWYYLFASASNCCNGPLTGYSVFAGRSRTPFGPFRDREGRSLVAARVGGTPVLSMNGNRWVGTGHNSVFRDRSGKWWTVYHAADRRDPDFATEPGFTKRPALLDPLDWVDGWPSVRSGRWASDARMPAPAAKWGQRTSYRASVVRPHRRGRLLPRFSDGFGGSALSDRWRWVREPAAGTYAVRGGRLRFATQAGDLFEDANTASVLTEPAPLRDYVVQVKVGLDVPPSGCCQNFVQAGLVVYGSDDAFVKLVHASIWETRQTEFAKELPSRRGPGLARYGNTVVGPPAYGTWLRVVRRSSGARQAFTAYTSLDGRRWVRGGTWVHNRLGTNVRIGLVSMGGAGYTASFDHVRVWLLRR